MNLPRRAGFALAGAFLLLALGSSVASAQDEPAFVPYCFDGGTFEVESGQDILLGCGWGATTKGLMQSFLNSNSKTLVLTDESGAVVWSLSRSEAADYWSALTSGPDGDGLECAGGVLYGAFWSYTLPALPDGTYTLTTSETFAHPINDGFHTCSFDGEAIPAPSKVPATSFDTVLTIVVG